MAVDVACTVIGLALVLYICGDVFRTVLLPASHAKIHRVASRLCWHLAVRVPGRRRSRALQLAGPLSIVVSVFTWLALLWTGYLLIYLPHLSQVAWSTEAGAPAHGVAAAAYLSGQSLTTLTFSDVVPQSPLLRTLAISEAALGLAVLTATLGYLPAIYTLMTDFRAANQAVADLDVHDRDNAAALLRGHGAGILDDVRRDLVVARQHLLRFPVLHYFHPPYDESVVALTRGAVVLYETAADGGLDEPFQERHAHALRRALDRLVECLAADSEVRSGAGDAAGTDSSVDRWHTVLEEYARRHRYADESR